MYYEKDESCAVAALYMFRVET